MTISMSSTLEKEESSNTTRTNGIIRTFEGTKNNHKIEHRRIWGTIRTFGTVSTCGTKWTL